VNRLPDQIVLYRSSHSYQTVLKRKLQDFGIVIREAQFLAEMQDLSFIEKAPCALAIIDDQLNGIEFLRSLMHYHTWTQRIMLTDSTNLLTFEQAINKAHINYLLHIPTEEQTLKTYLVKANRRFQNIMRPVHKLSALTSVTSNLLLENERMRLESQTDPLTRLLNRRSMNIILENLWHQYLTANDGFSFAILDIDHFKRVNDKYGHEAGDRVLQELSSLILHNLRKDQDFAFRYGGEEFALISTHMNAEKMHLFVERLLQLTREMVIHVGQAAIKITFSAGVSDTRQVKSPQEVMHQADKALYQAKNSGRNRIINFEK